MIEKLPIPPCHPGWIQPTRRIECQLDLAARLSAVLFTYLRQIDALVLSLARFVISVIGAAFVLLPTAHADRCDSSVST